jgi:digeranylgeranylglycerophospholipid reductase
MSEFDVTIVGAGPAGIMTAIELARLGVSVIVLEKKPRENIGRPVSEGIETSVFNFIDRSLPEKPILKPPPMMVEIVSPDGRQKIKIKELPLINVNLRLFLEDMLEEAESLNVRFLFETMATGPLIEDNRVVGVVGTTPEGRMLEIECPLSIDASGINGALRHHITSEMGMEQKINPHDVCNIWRESREIKREAVMALLERNRIRPQINVSRFGFMGPYSVFSIYVDLDDDRVDIVSGLAHDPAFSEARDLVNAYVEGHHWVGETMGFGGGLVPVRRPLDSFVTDGFACVGDAACQAFPTTGSGITSALYAGKILAEVAADAIDEGNTKRRALWPYNVRYMRSRGAAQANSALFRRFALSLMADEMGLLFQGGLVSVEGITGALEGLPLELPLSSVVASSVRMLRRPGLIWRLFRLSRDPLRVLDIYSSYPDYEDLDTFDEWTNEVNKIFDKWPTRSHIPEKRNEEDTVYEEQGS